MTSAKFDGQTLGQLRLCCPKAHRQRCGTAKERMIKKQSTHVWTQRLLAGAWFLARYGDGLAALLVSHAQQECPGHKAIFL